MQLPSNLFSSPIVRGILAASALVAALVVAFILWATPSPRASDTPNQPPSAPFPTAGTVSPDVPLPPNAASQRTFTTVPASEGIFASVTSGALPVFSIYEDLVAPGELHAFLSATESVRLDTSVQFSERSRVLTSYDTVLIADGDALFIFEPHRAVFRQLPVRDTAEWVDDGSHIASILATSEGILILSCVSEATDDNPGSCHLRHYDKETFSIEHVSEIILVDMYQSMRIRSADTERGIAVLRTIGGEGPSTFGGEYEINLATGELKSTVALSTNYPCFHNTDPNEPGAEECTAERLEEARVLNEWWTEWRAIPPYQQPPVTCGNITITEKPHGAATFWGCMNVR